MGDSRSNKREKRFTLVISMALSAIAIGLAPLMFLAAKYEVFGVLSLYFMLGILPLISFLIAAASLFFAIIGRRTFRFGWMFLILSCCALVFPFLFIYWALHEGGRY